MFDLDVRSRQPIYEQLIEKIKESIIIQALQPDEKLPSVRSLSQDLTVNPNTIQKAYRELERQGYVYSVQGKGNFVSPIEIMPNDEKLIDVKSQLLKLLSEAIYLGLTQKDLIELYEQAKQLTEGSRTDD
jgi:GntR family transcriptional regulator